MKTEKHDLKKNIRLLVILVYLLVVSPLQFQFFFKHGRESVELFIYKITVFFIFFLFEIIEFFILNPDENNKFLPRLMFLVRVLIVLPSLIGGFLLSGNVDPYYFLFIPLLGFYSSMILPGFFSIIFTMLIALVNIWLDISHFRGTNLEFYLIASIILQRIITILIFYLFAHFWQTDRRKSFENELLLEKLNKSEESLRVYASEIARTSVLEERTRIARDMHDSVGHALTAIQMQLRKALAFLRVDIDEAESSIEAVLEVTNVSLQDTRSVLNDLHNEEMFFSLNEKIQAVISTLKDAGLAVDFKTSGDDKNFNYAVLLALFRLIQEGTTNILRHADADHVLITLKYYRDSADLIIEDDGRGFTLKKSETPGRDSGFGLHGLRERFELIRGMLTIESQPGKGTKLVARVPKDPVKLIGDDNE